MLSYSCFLSRLCAVCDPEVFTGDEYPQSYLQTLNMARPRMIKTHLSYPMLPNQIMEKKSKVKFLLLIFLKTIFKK